MANAYFDINQDNCQSGIEFEIPVTYYLDSGIQNGYLSSSDWANLSYQVPAGTYTLEGSVNSESEFLFQPNSATINFPAGDSTQSVEFCISSLENIEDLVITIVPIENAQAGFEVSYEIAVSNLGTVPLQPEVRLDFPEDLMDFISSEPATTSVQDGHLIWQLEPLNPFDKTSIQLNFQLNGPMDPFPLIGGEVLNFKAEVLSTEAEINRSDNVISLNQTVVNSFDPNQKACLQGDIIRQDQLGN